MTAARMSPIEGRDGWYLTSVNRHQAEGRYVTEVALTHFADAMTNQGESLTFTIPGTQPRAVILASAIEHIDRWSRDAGD